MNLSLPDVIKTKEDVDALFEYRDGNLYWKHRIAHCVHVGEKAGNCNEYSQVKYKEKAYLIHRLVFLLHHGYLPKFVDHVDNNPRNNRIENLREATNPENGWNRKINKNNATGMKGVSYERGAYKVVVTVNKKPLYFGRYDDPELADLVAIEARNKYHQQYARHA